jgi:hypothetical protein
VKFIQYTRLLFIYIAATGLISTGWTVSESKAQEAPKCNEDTFGQVACFSIKLCECIYDRGGTMTGLPARYRWDCGILRPMCFDTSTSIQEYYRPQTAYPYTVGIDLHRPTRKRLHSPRVRGGKGQQKRN